MAGITNTITRQGTLSDGNNTVVGSVDVVTSGANPVVRESILANQTQLEVDQGAFINAKLKSIILHATVDMLLETNDAETPQDTIHLKAGKALLWSLNDSYFGVSNASPFAGNVTKWFVTNTTAGDLTISPIVDPT